MKSRKKLYIIIFCSVLIVVIISVVRILKPAYTRLSASDSRRVDSGIPFCNSPLDKYDFTDCKVGVFADNGEIIGYLTEERIEEFIEILLQANINKYGLSDYPIYAGKSCPYRVFFENGEVINIIHLGGPYLLLGEKAYKCYDEGALTRLDELSGEI
ncbi:MAG: hypothetical protein NC223_06650 [Butyrivibrio sp.]|nr:hypothetical protein [Butyrivibrio sp.]